jgi:hypothetical protein
LNHKLFLLLRIRVSQRDELMGPTPSFTGALTWRHSKHHRMIGVRYTPWWPYFWLNHSVLLPASVLFAFLSTVCHWTPSRVRVMYSEINKKLIALTCSPLQYLSNGIWCAGFHCMIAWISFSCIDCQGRKLEIGWVRGRRGNMLFSFLFCGARRQ